MERRHPVARLIPALLWRWLLALLLWWVLAEGVIDGLLAPLFALLAAIVSLMLSAPGSPGKGQLSLPGLIAFIPFFLRQSLLGGLDIARRALHPDVPLSPSVIHYPLQLPPGWPQLCFLNTLSLLPGTLAVRLDDGQVTIHLLGNIDEPQHSLQDLEQRIARLFGLKTDTGGHRP